MRVRDLSVSLVHAGLDTISLLGTRIVSNEDFVFVSANGYNNYNGAIVVLHKEDLSPHSVVHSPEPFHANVGWSLAVNQRYLVAGGLAYDIYTGVVYIYEWREDTWMHVQTLRPKRDPLLGFGEKLIITPNHQVFVQDLRRGVYSYMVHDDDDVAKIVPTRDQPRFWNVVWEPQEGCTMGSFVVTSEEHVMVSCSLVYPFSEGSEGSPKVYDYDLSWKLRETIFPPETDAYFGTSVALLDTQLAVSGTRNIYYYEYVGRSWTHMYTIRMPASRSPYDYQMLILPSKEVLVGHYAFDEWEGGLFLAKLPSVATSSSLEGAVGSLRKQLVSLFLLLLGGILVTMLVTLTCYLIVQGCTPVSLKKKKKEEEESPYKVYSYKGYVETDDPTYCKTPHMYNYPLNYMPTLYYQPVLMYQPIMAVTPSQPEPLSPMEKGLMEKGLKGVGASKETVATFKRDEVGENKETPITYEDIQRTYQTLIKPYLVKNKCE